jgi:hypothetical protein
MSLEEDEFKLYSSFILNVKYHLFCPAGLSGQAASLSKSIDGALWLLEFFTM